MTPLTELEDLQLLARYRQKGANPCFEELVRRHIGVVYSVAHRALQGNTALAQDVCQETFLLLAKKSESLPKNVVLSGWLYRCALNLSRTARRNERRRRAREIAAAAMQEPEATTPRHNINWQQIQPLLGDALSRLKPRDQDALCLRFFEEKSFKEIGQRLQLSENAARMRVNRALEKLNGFLARQGITSTSALLSVAFAHHASLTAPTGLVSAIAAHAAALPSAASLSLATKLIHFANTTKFATGVATIASATAITLAIYQFNRLEAAQAELLKLSSQSHQNAAHLQDFVARRDALAAPSSIPSAPTSAALPPHGIPIEEFEDVLESWVEKVDRVSAFLDQRPEFSIPELALLDSVEWMTHLRMPPLETEADLRAALGTLRRIAKSKMAPKLHEAIREYRKAHGTETLVDSSQLVPYLDASVNPLILARLSIVPPQDERRIRDGLILIEDKLADPIWDHRIFVRERGFGTEQLPTSNMHHAIQKATERFQDDEGRAPTGPAELEPYLQSSVLNPHSSKLVPHLAEAFAAMNRPAFPTDEGESPADPER